MGSQSKLDFKQLFWGAISGVITVALMYVSYNTGFDRGQEEEVLGEGTEQQTVEEREVYIAVKADCSEYNTELEEEGVKEIKKYCLTFKDNENAFELLKRLDESEGDFIFSSDESDFGAFITSINNYHPDVRKEFWAFYVNGEMSITGVSDVMLSDGDEISFILEKIEV